MSATANRRLAFTLLELLVVIAIIMIVTTLTLMAYRGIASDMRMSAAVQDVTIVMEQARSRAIRDGKATLVVLRPR
ncbi:MAG: prepilin-type N-terminal cleavage/methylation domain-containing protein, partial [Phycisphaerales bacterium]|nr:prepilin-type N-terminal cleavage/methylation domain-containing protein [Phycisphaerales bacterium]